LPINKKPYKCRAKSRTGVENEELEMWVRWGLFEG